MQNERKLIGDLAVIQVQSWPLKRGSPGNRYFDPANLVVVAEALLTPRGVVGIRSDGSRIVDAHHADHPESRFSGVNGISIGFTGHYDRMRTRFGDHLADGVAGENLIISSGMAPGMEDLAGRMIFENPDGTSVEFRLFKAMAPCDEFSHYVNGAADRLPAQVLKETLQFLDGGTRGFALQLVGAFEARLLTGAKLYQNRM